VYDNFIEESNGSLNRSNKTEKKDAPGITPEKQKAKTLQENSKQKQSRKTESKSKRQTKKNPTNCFIIQTGFLQQKFYQDFH